MLVGVIADTHMTGGMTKGRRKLPPACVDRLAECRMIVHAGDVMTAAALAEIEAIGPPVEAVLGNVDSFELRGRLPPERVLELPGGAKLAIVHDAGPATGRIKRLRLRFPEAAAVVFGHSHMPLHERDGDFQIFNPGSPTERRRAPRHSMGLARVERGAIEFELVPL
jgi:putative phosphoesterase